MRSKKIFRILSVFTDKEWRACYKYLKYCNQRQSKSLQIFESAYHYRKKKLTDQELHNRIRTKIFEGLNEKTFLNRLSDLTKDVEDFLVIETLKNAEHAYDYHKTLSSAYAQKGLYPYFEQTIYKSKEILLRKKTIDLFDTLRVMEVNHTLYFSDLFDGRNKPFDALREAELNRKQFTDTMGLFYETEYENISHLFRISNDEVEQKTILKERLTQLKSVLQNKDWESFEQLEAHILYPENDFSDELNHTILLTLINFCIHQLKSGHVGMVDKIAQFYLYGLEKEYLLHHGMISEIRFLNIVDALGHSNLALKPEEFIQKWSSKVTTQDTLSIQNIAHAMWAFAQEKYQETLEILYTKSIVWNRINITQRARWIQLCAICTVYPDHEGKEEVLKATSAFFKRHQGEMNEPTYLASMNLIHIVRMIWNGDNHDDIASFVEKCDYLVMRTWLTKQLK